MKKLLLKLSFFSFLFVLLFSSEISRAQGDLMIMPKRLVFDGSDRSQEIHLANTGSDTAVYAISFVNYKMTESGNFEEVEEPEEGQRFAEDFLRYFPRRVSLAPGEAQTVRVQLTRTGNLEQGEYRSHIKFRAVEEQTALGEDEVQEGEGISINIKTVFGISIPIIIREGEPTTEIGLKNVELQQQVENHKLSFVLTRTGNMSVYGNIKVNHISPDGITTEVGFVKGVSVYTPNNKREFSFEFRNDVEVDLTSGKLEILYSEENGETFAKTTYEPK